MGGWRDYLPKHKRPENREIFEKMAEERKKKLESIKNGNFTYED